MDTGRAHILAWLATADGEALLSAARALPDDRLTRLDRLRRLVTAEVAAVAVELVELRRRARPKFAYAERMFFTPEGLEQATGDAVAAYRASHFPAEGAILDACCGIGGDARHLATRGAVLAVDRDAAAAICARFNCGLPTPGARAAIHVLCADVTSLPLARLAGGGVRAAFVDPSRRADRQTGGRRRVRSPDDYAPPLGWLAGLRAHFESVAAKVSPAVDDEALRVPGARVEFISDRGECKEAVLWFGAPAEALPLPPGALEPYFATVLRPDRAAVTLGPSERTSVGVAPIGDTLYEPDPAVIRAHLVPQLAARLGASLIEPGVPYLTSSDLVVDPFATPFRIVEALPYSEKAVQRRLRALGAYVSDVKKRGVPFEPAEVRKRLAPCGDRALVLVLMRRAGRVTALLCERAGSS